jgi:predicted ATP-grasp superfamily ATP-dependent carboligase
MKVLVAEYASSIGLGGTCEFEGRAILSTLVESFSRCGHEVTYLAFRHSIDKGKPIILKTAEEFEYYLKKVAVDAGLLIAPDHLQAHFLEILEENAINLGSSPSVASLCADKLACTQKLKEFGVPVAEIATLHESHIVGCNRFVIKPRYGCGSDGVRISSSSKTSNGYIATSFCNGMHLSASFIIGERFLPLTINRQIIKFENETINYKGSLVPYKTPRFSEIWEVMKNAANILGLKGYAGIDFVMSDFPRVVDVNARPTTSIVGISKVIKAELADLILKAKFGDMPESVGLEGEFTFRISDII